MDYLGRIARLRNTMHKQGIDLLLLAPSTDLFYLTGIRERVMERLVMLLLTDQDLHFIAPDFELANLKKESERLLTIHGWSDGEDPFRVVEELLPVGEKTAAIGGQAPSWILLGNMRLRPGYQWTVADGLLREMRAVKDETERRLLREAQEDSCRAFTRLLEHGLCGMREIDVAKRLIEYTNDEGMDMGMPIVASGPNSALPHHRPGERVIEPGDAVVIDFDGEFRGIGYQADTTRTVAVKHIPEGLREIYDITRKANQAAFEAAKPGTPCQEVDRAARAVITEAGYGEFFTHRLGHGLGMDVHEHPYLVEGNTEKLRVGNVVSNEPGIYLPGRHGVRIEDQMYIGPEGAERLTPLGHDLQVVD